jgi:hypothetical protein
MSSRSPRRRHALRGLLLLGLAGATACTHWHTEHVAPATLIDSVAPTRVRLTLRDTATSVAQPVQDPLQAPRVGAGQPMRVVLEAPRIQSDSIAGLGSARRPISVALQDVTKVERRTVSWGHTVALLLTPPALLFGLACLYGCGD